MLDATQPFVTSMSLTVPYLQSRSVGGALMVASHLLFAAHFVVLILGRGPERTRAARIGAAVGARP